LDRQDRIAADPAASGFPRIPLPDSADIPKVDEDERRQLAARRLGARDALLRARRALHRAGPEELARVLDGMLGEPMEKILAELDAVADRAVQGGERS
jgi:hypothetical protein